MRSLRRGPVSLRGLLLLLAVFARLPLRAEVDPNWTKPLPPFRIADDLYYVGSRDLASYLITTPDGNILINANLASSPPQIRASVEKLGFRWADTKIFLNSQAHFDHVGGAAQILRETSARNMVMEGDAIVMETGGRADFAFGKGITSGFTPTHVDTVLHDGDVIKLGDPGRGGVALVAHRTAGHTRGCTTFTLRRHLPGDPPNKLRDVVIVGGLAALPSYRLIGTPGHPASYPGIADDFRLTFATLLRLHCDLFLGAHGIYFELLPKLQRMPAEGPAVFLDPAGYKAAIVQARDDFEKKVARERRRNAARVPATHHPASLLP